MQTNSYQTRFWCVGFLSKKKVKIEIYPKMALSIKTVRHNWWCICPSSLVRVFANNFANIFNRESNYIKMGHIIYIRIVNKIKNILEV